MGRLAIWLCAGLLTCGSAEALGDWQVKRSPREAAAREAEAFRALVSRPDDEAIAARLAKRLSAPELASLLERLRSSSRGSSVRTRAYAQLLLASGRAEEAAEAFRQAVDLEPRVAGAAVGLAHALEAAGRFKEALAAFERALPLVNDERPRRALLRKLAASAERAGDFAQSLSARQELAARAPAGRVTLDLAEALARADRHGEAADLIEAHLVATSSHRLEAASLAARLRQTAGDDEGAERVLRLGIASERREGPTRAALWDRLIAVARLRDTLPALERELEDGIAAGRSTAGQWRALASVRETLGDFEGAAAAYRRAAALAPTDRLLVRRLSRLLARLGDRTQVEARSAERGVEPGGLSLEAMDDRFRRGDKEEARRQFDVARRRARHDLDALIRLADLASRWGDHVRVLASWDAVLALSPTDERGIVGLGEAHFQAGRRELARRTWQQLLGAVKPKASAHARLAELLGDHDFVEEAVAEARAAQKLEPENPAHRRTLARILERKRDAAGAIAEWRIVLAKTVEPSKAAERREARSRLLSLLSREGRTRLAEEAEPLRDHVRRHPGDREAVLFLTELEQRLQDPTRALETLRAAAEQNPADAELVLALVRLLRQSRQPQEAVSRLETLARKTPSRALDAHLQRADIELARYGDTAALAALAQAKQAAGDDPDALIRIAALEERAGRDDLAVVTYGQALARAVSVKGALALFALLARQGDSEAGLRSLLAAARGAPDPETEEDLFGRALDAAELVGAIPRLVRAVASSTTLRGPAEGRLYAELLRRELPTLYREAGSDTKAAARRDLLARLALRPLLELVTEPDTAPDGEVIELIGMLGQRQATPILARLSEWSPSPAAAATGARSGGAQAAVIALGRLGDPRATPALSALVDVPNESLRAAALWALGRIEGANPDIDERLATALTDERPEIVALAALGLGRRGSAPHLAALNAMALDTTRSALERRGAIVGLRLSGTPAASPQLLERLPALAGGGDLGREAVDALAAFSDAATLRSLFELALLADPSGRIAAFAALSSHASGAASADEALAIKGDRLDVSALLDALVPPRTGTAFAKLELLLDEHAAEIAVILRRALASAGPARLRALEALGARQDALGLGPLLPSQGPLGIAARRALARIAADIEAPVIALLDAGDGDVRRAAFVVACRIKSPAIRGAHIAAAIADGPERDVDPRSGALGGAASAGAAVLLTRPGGPAALSAAVRPLLRDQAWQKRAVALRVLGLARLSSEDEVERAARDPSPFVRVEAARAVATLSGPKAVRLRKRLAHDQAEAVRRAAVGAAP